MNIVQLVDFSARLRYHRDIRSAFPYSRTLSKAFHLAATDNATFQDNQRPLFISNRASRRRIQVVVVIAFLLLLRFSLLTLLPPPLLPFLATSLRPSSSRSPLLVRLFSANLRSDLFLDKIETATMTATENLAVLHRIRGKKRRNRAR